MFWSRGSSRQRKAVLSALSAVGETGMTLLALGLAVNIPEGRLTTILEGLVRSGQVRRRGAASSTIPGPRTAHYHLASSRHSVLPRIPTRRVSSERSAESEQSGQHRAARRPQSPAMPAAPIIPAAPVAPRRASAPAGLHTTRAQGI